MGRAGRVAAHKVFPNGKVLVAQLLHPPRLPRRFPDFQRKVGPEVKAVVRPGVYWHFPVLSALSNNDSRRAMVAQIGASSNAVGIMRGIAP